LRIDIVPERITRRMRPKDKARMILERVKGNAILVLEERLKPEEQAELIKETMMEIDCEQFCGIEVVTFNEERRKGKITVVAPSNVVEVARQGDLISLMLGGCLGGV